MAERLFLIQFGAERVSKRLSLRRGRHHLYWEPFIGVLVETSEGWVLLDTGMSKQAYDDPANQQAYRDGCLGASNEHDPWHLSPEPPAAAFNWIAGTDPLATALASVGLAPQDLAMAAVSHLHVDHSGGIPALAKAGVRIVIQQNELEFVRSGAVGIAEGFHPPDWSEPTTQWIAVDGDAEIAPGVSVVATPGHTPGHQSFRVDLPGTGTWLFAADAADLGQNFLDATPCGSCAGGTADDERKADESLTKLLRIARSTDARIIPGHDQLVFNACRHPPGGHR